MLIMALSLLGNTSPRRSAVFPTVMLALRVGTSTPEAFTRTPIGEPLPQDLQDRGYHIRDTLQSRAAA
jgi:hypothetical protein